MRRIFLAAVSVSTALLLAGCSAAGDSDPDAAPTASSTPTATATAAPATSVPTTPVEPAPTPAPSADPVDPNAPALQCADGDLALTLANPDSGAGSMYIDIVFTNEGDTVCELRGAPGVSVVDDDGTQIGAASRTLYPDVIPTATLQPGASTAATLQSVNVAGSGGPLDTACDATVGAGYRIYPPHSFRSVFVEVAEVAACASGVEWMSVGVVALN